MKNPLTTLVFFFFLLFFPSLQAQDHQPAIQLALDHLKTHCTDFGITPADAAGVWVSSAYSSRKSGVTHVYFNQMYQGIEVLQAAGNANIGRNGALINMNVRFVRNLAGKITQTAPDLSAEQAVRALAGRRAIELPPVLVIEIKEEGPMQKVKFAKGDFAAEPVSVHLAYYQDEALGIRLVWEVEFYEKGAGHRWNAGVDAADGKILFMRDRVLYCDFGVPGNRQSHSRFSTPSNEDLVLNDGAGYNVFPVPVESPNHGDRIVVINPADSLASPYGWHDMDGTEGTDTTITMGNNVHAYQDASNLDGPAGDEPDGGPGLLFDFPYDPDTIPELYRDAAVTNLFYWCNIMHDVWYHYGFDEPAGNFQFNNYGHGGLEGDYLRAEAQDGSGTNNANFSSAEDGTDARIQMYLWYGEGEGDTLLTILSPDTIAGGYVAVEAGFGPGLPSAGPITDTLVLVDDGSALPTQGCGPLVNAAYINGNIALVDRGNCTFVEKVLSAQDAGAIAVIVCNNNDEPPFSMGGFSADITIPSVMISKADCDIIKVELANGVVASLLGAGAIPARDGDFDNGIIAHEYAHGVSIRLTGGPATADCLNNSEQMGEGWSDYICLMLTIEEGDQGGDIRGVGTFALDEPVDGIGIRPAPYSTDFSINDYTYAATNDVFNISEPHGVGFVWATMLWDMTWKLIDQYGFDPDLYYGTGGNNIAMQLVAEGMKLQPCSPGFIDGRDAILLADQQLYGGANQCLIWEAFAGRGLGKSASQGSPFSRSDQVEAFDLPNICLIPVAPPSAAFAIAYANECTGSFSFEDQSTDTPHYWFWDFGDGNTSTEEDPSHVYDAEGVYDVTLIVTNTLGADTLTQQVTVDYIDPPLVEDALVCEGSPATLSAPSGGFVINWYQNDVLVFSGQEFVTPPVTEPVTYMVGSEDQKPLQQVGPPDNSIGPGGYHNTGFTGTEIFEAHVPFILESVWVDAGDAGDRLIELFDMSGNAVNSVNVYMPAGQSTVTLNLEVPAPGMYQVGGTSINLYRNTNGAEYPYEVPGIVTITGSSATSDPQNFYYYLYDWKVRELSCFSEQVPVNIEVMEAPVAQFDFDQEDPNITFADASTDATSWSWDFGDGGISAEQNPVHTYHVNGTYLVTLIVSNGSCQDTVSC